MHPDELDRLADRLFTAFTDWDLDAVAAMMAPDAVVVQNGRRSSFDAFRVELEAIRRLIGEHRYEDVRRVIGDHAVVEEHAVRATAPDCAPWPTSPVCPRGWRHSVTRPRRY